jgi:formylglycine-generating enzyme required for sulfatase activity
MRIARDRAERLRPGGQPVAVLAAPVQVSALFERPREDFVERGQVRDVDDRVGALRLAQRPTAPVRARLVLLDHEAELLLHQRAVADAVAEPGIGRGDLRVEQAREPARAAVREHRDVLGGGVHDLHDMLRREHGRELRDRIEGERIDQRGPGGAANLNQRQLRPVRVHAHELGVEREHGTARTQERHEPSGLGDPLVLRGGAGFGLRGRVHSPMFACAPADSRGREPLVVNWYKYRNAIGGALGVLLLAGAFVYRWVGPDELPVVEAGGVSTRPRIDVQAAIQRALAVREEPLARPEDMGPPAPPLPQGKTGKGAGALEAAPSIASFSAEVQAEVDDALSRAQRALKAGNLLAPAEDNALYWYDAALELDQTNRAAREGRRKLLANLFAQANASLDSGDSKLAEDLVLALDTAKDMTKEKAEIATRVQAIPKIGPLLAEASARAGNGKLYEPPGESALDSYRAVLVNDPRHGAAKQALGEIEEAVLKQALGLASQNDYVGADKLLALGDTIGADVALESDTRRRVAELKRDYARALLDRAVAALDAQNVTLAEPLIDEAAALGVADDLVAALKTRLSNARIYEHRNPGEILVDSFVDHTGNGPALAVIPLGTFEMGSVDRERGRREDEGPRHAVAITRAFALGVTEVTVSEYRRFVEATGYQGDAEKQGQAGYYDEANGRISLAPDVTWQKDYRNEMAPGELPVVHVSWNDALAYVTWLGTRTGHNYRLPSEAEFEYALRAGSATPYWWGEGNPTRLLENLTGDGDRSPSKRSWTKSFPRYNDGFWGPAPVKHFAANPFGLYDLAGNVSEWVDDCWHDSYLRAPVDGSSWVNKGCARRVVRGGSWGSSPEQVRSASRIASPVEVPSPRIGFRVARDL